MVAERRDVNVDETDSIQELLRIVEQEHAPVILRRNGVVVAVVSPPDGERLDQPVRRGTIEDLLKFAGSMPDAFADDFIEENRARRQIPSRSFDWE